MSTPPRTIGFINLLYALADRLAPPTLSGFPGGAFAEVLARADQHAIDFALIDAPGVVVMIHGGPLPAELSRLAVEGTGPVAPLRAWLLVEDARQEVRRIAMGGAWNDLPDVPTIPEHPPCL